MSTSSRYEVFESLGANDYFTVYRGWDARLRKYVAIMELDARFRNNPQQYDAVWEEVLATASLEHYGFVRVYEVAKENGWIITELMHGTLADRIEERPLTLRELRSVLHTAFDALQWLHGKGRLHGDIRPANFLINDEGHVRLSHPVGLAVGGQVPRRTMNQEYLAPELVNPEFGDTGPHTDLYTLGFSAYELAIGKEFDGRFFADASSASSSGNAALSWLRWHSSADKSLPPIEQSAASITGEVAKVVDRLVEKQVANRIQTAEEAIAILGDQQHEEEAVFSVPGIENFATGNPDTGHYHASNTALSSEERVVNSSRLESRSSQPNSRRRGQDTQRSRTSEPQPWTSEWLHEKFQNPWIFRSIAAGVLSIAALVGIALRPSEQGKGNGKDDINDPMALVEKRLDELETRLGQTENSLLAFDGSVTRLSEGLKSLEMDIVSSLDDQQLEFSNLKDAQTVMTERQNQFTAYIESNSDAFDDPLFNDENDVRPSERSIASDLGEISLALDRFKQSLLSTEEALAKFDQSVATRLALAEQGSSSASEIAGGRVENPLSGNASSRVTAKSNAEAHELALSASQKFESGDDEGGIKQIRRAIEMEPSRPVHWLSMAAAAHIRRGEDFYERQQYRRAIDDFTQAIELQPPVSEMALALRYRGAAYVLLNEAQTARADFDQAERSGVTPLRSWPKAAEALVDWGTNFFDSESYSEALKQLDTATVLDSTNIEAFRMRGKTFLERSDPVKALPDLDRAIELAEGQRISSGEPAYQSALYNRGRARLELGMNAQAEDDFSQILSADPDYLLAYIRRGIARTLDQDYRSAVADFDKALNLDPRSYAAYNNRGASYLYLKRYDDAVDDFSRAIAIDDSIPNAYFNRHLAYNAMGRTKKANSDLAQSRGMEKVLTD